MSQVSAVIKEMIRQQLLTLHTCLVCKVLEIYSDGTAKVQPCTMMQTAKGTVKQHVALDGVPILDQIRSTVSVGKACVVVFAERDISAVRYAEFALPSASRHHSLSDGIIIGTIDGSGTVIPGESSVPLPSETATAKTSTNKKANGTEVQVDVKVSRQSGNKLQAKSDGLFVPESPDTNTTYNISKDGSTLKLTGSDGSESSVAIPESKNTTYRVSSGIFPSSHGVTLRGSDGSNSIAPLETYRRSLYLPDATAKNMNRVTERGYLYSTHGYAFTLTMSRYDSSHRFEMSGTYSKDDENFDFIIHGDISVGQGVPVITNLSIDCNDPDNRISVYAYNIFEPATETHDYVYYYAWIAVYSNKDLSDWSCRVLTSIHYTDGEYIELSTPPDSEHSVDYVKMEEQVVKTADENTKYELSKTGSTITLTGSDGTSSSVTDSDTTYELVQYTDEHNGDDPAGPIVLLKDSDGSSTEIVIPRAMTYSSWDAVYKEYYGNIPGSDKYASLVDIVYQCDEDYDLSVIIDAYLMVKYGAVQYGCRVKIYRVTDETYAEVFPPPILSSPKIKWTVLSYRTSGGYMIYRICIDQATMQNIFDSAGSARLLFSTDNDGKLIKQAQRTVELDAELDGYHGTVRTTYVILSSRNAPDVAFTGDYNDLSNKPAIPDKSKIVTHGANTAVGSATKPVYIAANGVATPITHSINSDVPANAKFTDTTYSDATQSAHGLMAAADKKKLDGMDLSKYLPKAGGVMVGDIDMATNKKDILVGTQKASTSSGTPIACGTINTDKTFQQMLPTMRSFIGTYNYKTSSTEAWYDIISVRHRNGYNDGSSWGMFIYANLFGGNLQWNLNTNKDVWQGTRTLLDSSNYTSYAAKTDHTHAMITNSMLQIGGANNAEKWVRLGTLVSGGDARSAIIRVWSGNGYNAGAYQNASFEIQIKDGYQSTHSAAKACGVTVYRINCSTVKVKVIPTAHNTYTVWVYLPWKYWNGNYAVYGRYTSWTYDGSNQTAEPEGTAADTAYYDQAFLTSTVAKANEATALTETAWTDVPATGADSTSERNLKYLVMGNTVYVQGYLKFSAGNNNPKCGTLPGGARPNDTLCFTSWDTQSGVPTAFPIVVNEAGIIMLMNPTSTAYWFKAGRAYRFNFSYHIN